MIDILLPSNWPELPLACSAIWGEKQHLKNSMDLNFHSVLDPVEKELEDILQISTEWDSALAMLF